MATFSMNPKTAKPRNKQPEGGGLIDLDAELRNFPGGCAYRVASPEVKDRVIALVARILAEEPILASAATAKAEKAIELLQAQILRPMLRSKRKEYETMRAAERLLATNIDAETIATQRGLAGDALEQAEARLRDALSARDTARAEVDRLVHLDAHRAEAELILAPTDPATLAGWAHWQAIKPEE